MKPLAECTEAYFRQSEQLPTRLFIRTGEAEGNAAAAGMLLQVLPAQDGNLDDFDHLVQLTNTVKSEELFGLPANEVLYRLYHQKRSPCTNRRTCSSVAPVRASVAPTRC